MDYTRRYENRHYSMGSNIFAVLQDKGVVMRLIDADVVIKKMRGCFIDIIEENIAVQIVKASPSIDVPTKPIADVIGYRWKLKWVLEEAPDIIDALMERSRR